MQAVSKFLSCASALSLVAVLAIGCGSTADTEEPPPEEETTGSTEEAQTKFVWCESAGECLYCLGQYGSYWYHCHDGSSGWIPE